MTSFTTLDAWQNGIRLVKEIYKITSQFPNEEKFGLSSQMRRASTSILANIAEGYSRRTKADKYHKYIIARGECSELHAFILIVIELKYLSKEDATRLIDLTNQEGQMLSGMVRKFT
ncbi:MAG: four helix bundle protein [Candidatus Peribacteraceae bacterium]|jgi:four helix bundle protein|nr:four helix bundle protein [Candidatus Peribacteraceae bacterium]MDP7453957.1 four helix bundle protein [Candidatus Peribacteraceae bacterium]MDP7645604.1 four helix bundle protein [Candidatus Peribacteraceae bacterium]|tara:strand:- start:81 stop:431 length:351 start_codon:yes stop_codon:yes gene_type:complete